MDKHNLWTITRKTSLLVKTKKENPCQRARLRRILHKQVD